MADILLIEDEESVNRGIELTLTKEEYQVSTAGTIQQADRLIKQDNPEMIICDVNLPDGSGFDLIRRFRKESMAHTICLTAMDTEIDQVMGYEAGADDYVTKPFSLSVLVLKVNYHIPLAEIPVMVLSVLQISLSYILSRNVKKESVVERIRYQE